MPKDGRNYDPPLIKSFLAQALKLNDNVDVMLHDNTQLASAAASLWSHIKVCYIFVITYQGMLHLCGHVSKYATSWCMYMSSMLTNISINSIQKNQMHPYVFHVTDPSM